MENNNKEKKREIIASNLYFLRILDEVISAQNQSYLSDTVLPTLQKINICRFISIRGVGVNLCP